jgi:hypothetical protein
VCRDARVWTGELRRDSTFFIAPVVEGAQASSFRVGTGYLVTVYGSVSVFNADDAASAAEPTGQESAFLRYWIDTR